MGRYNGGALGADKPLLLKIRRAYTTSGTFTAPANGWVATMQMGGGGGGGGGATATGGSSAAWAGKLWRVSAGQTLTITVGAKGLGAAALGTNGSDGGTTIITDGVSTVTTLGGKGGIGNATAIASIGPDGAAYPTGGDFGAGGSKAGNTAAVNNSRTGGAGVDLMAKGANATRSGNSTAGFATGGGSVTWPSADAAGSDTAGAGYGGPSIDTFGGPDIFGGISTAGTYMAREGEWGIPYFGNGGTNNDLAKPGGGGGGGSDGQPSRNPNGGVFAGGGGQGNAPWATRTGHGGYGAGGGGGGTLIGGGVGGHGGSGYVWLEFATEGAV